MQLGLRVRLSAMMFLQYMMLPVWFNTAVPYLRTLPGGEAWIVWCGMLLGFGTLSSPVVCMIADRFMNAERVLALINFLYAVFMGIAFFIDDPKILFFVLLFAAILNMPGWSLSSTIVMASSSSSELASVRVFGSVGWFLSFIFSMIGVGVFGIADFETSPWIFACASMLGFAGALVALIQTKTPPSAENTPMSIAEVFGLKALKLFRNLQFALFVILIVCSMVPFQWYMAFNTMYLQDSGFKYLNFTQNLGVLAEIGFVLIVPLLVRKVGYRWAMTVAFSALAFRYGAFLLSVVTSNHIFDYLGILVHGLIFGVIVVGAQMYVDDNAPVELRNQAQGMIMTLMTSVGTFISVPLFTSVINTPCGEHDWKSAYIIALVMSVVLSILMGAFALFARHKKI